MSRCEPGCTESHLCTKCNVVRPCSDYLRRKNGTKNGKGRAGERVTPCRACRTAYSAAWRKANPDKRRAQEMSFKYGLTPEALNALLAKQGGVCAICGRNGGGGRWGQLHVDHDHACCPGGRSCGKCVRGLLCHSCNTALGHLADSPALLRKAADYVEQQMLNQLPDPGSPHVRRVSAL